MILSNIQHYLPFRLAEEAIPLPTQHNGSLIEWRHVTARRRSCCKKNRFWMSIEHATRSLFAQNRLLFNINILIVYKKCRLDHDGPPVDTLHHSNFSSAQWRVHGGVDVYTYVSIFCYYTCIDSITFSHMNVVHLSIKFGRFFKLKYIENYFRLLRTK